MEVLFQNEKIEKKSIEQLLKQKLYWDCLIRCLCRDKKSYIEIKCHRIILGTLPYFSNLFNYTKLEKNLEEFYCIININIPFNERTFLFVINELYNEEKIESTHNICEI